MDIDWHWAAVAADNVADSHTLDCKHLEDCKDFHRHYVEDASNYFLGLGQFPIDIADDELNHRCCLKTAYYLPYTVAQHSGYDW